MVRKSELKRVTQETEISISLKTPGLGQAVIDTKIPFFDHMLAQLAKHGNFNLQLRATGDLEVDFHHTVEDVGIIFGLALKELVADRRGIRRFGHALIPMDDALSRVVVDLSGRGYLYTDLVFTSSTVGQFHLELVEEFLRSLAIKGELTLHVELLHGKNTHHQVESIFKALGQSLLMALAETGSQEIPSTKGVL